MASIRVGTCSWTDPTLIKCGRFYPAAANTPEARLRHYSSQFALVEVDSSYYALPAPQTVALWVERTPDDFTFDVKAFSLFTQHPAQVRTLPKDVRGQLPAQVASKRNLYAKDLPDELRDELWHRFAEALLPLDSAGKLGAVLFQFPPWFFPSRANREYILSLKRRLPQYRLAVEFRSAAWLDEGHREGTLSLLREADLPFVCVDEPQGFRSSVPPLAEVTSTLALVRFHGRNEETWEKKGISAAERFNYLYSEAELEGWLPRIEALAAQAKEVHILFNNCYEDKAVVNGQQLGMMLHQRQLGDD